MSGNWMDIYKKKLCTAEEAARAVKSGDRIMNPLCLGQPTNLIMDAIADRKGELKDCEFNALLTLRPYKIFKPEYRGSFRINSGFLGTPNVRSCFPESESYGRYVPVSSFSTSKQYSYYRRPDVVILMVTPPDKDGFVNLGPDLFYTRSMVEGLQTSRGIVGGARVVIAEENDQYPPAFGHTKLHISKITHIVRNSVKLPAPPPPTPTDAHHKIAANVVSLLRDRDTIQIGIGALPMVVSDLIVKSDLKDIGVLTEMLPTGAPQWVEKGICTGKYKKFRPGEINCTFMGPSQDLYEFIQKNEFVKFFPSIMTNHPSVLGAEDQLVGINGALEIDLAGQVASLTCGERIFSGHGGQIDFAMGCRMSEFGRMIIATESVGRDENRNPISRIVKFLKPGGLVNIPAHLVDFVVTENGVAGPLEGMSIAERTEELIKVAHPKFQDELVKAAKERGIFK
ncbi:MAG: acetyl-CoA hydrolase/transferase family protein [Syntrophales bacterium]